MKNRKLIKMMKVRGWTYEITSGNHLKFTHEASKEFIICASSASDHRAMKNMLAMVRRVEEGRANSRLQR